MKIIIDGSKYSFKPEKLKWQFQSSCDTEFSFCRIKNYQCFVKRQPQPFSGWHLIVKSISRDQLRQCPRVLSIAKDDNHYYYFTELLKGDLLENNGHRVNGKKLINSLFLALYNINQHGFWYSDLCSKNIFVTSKGDYFLIDIDSAFPHTQKIHNKFNISYEYATLLVKFGKETGLGKCDMVNGHSGECQNQAMLVAIATDIKHSFQIPLQRKDSVIHGILMRNYRKEYQALFSKLINGQTDWAGTRKLIGKIVN